MAVTTRLRQGLRAMFAFTQPVDDTLAAHYLSHPALMLFKQLRRGEQLHSLNVLRAVLAQSSTAPDALAIAALMHDIGKTRYPLRLWQKTIAVLVRKFIPPLFAKLSAGDPHRFINRPFVVYVHHPEWSGELLDGIGAPADAVWLARHHADDTARWVDHPLHPLLVRLQLADDSN